MTERKLATKRDVMDDTMQPELTATDGDGPRDMQHASDNPDTNVARHNPGQVNNPLGS